MLRVFNLADVFQHPDDGLHPGALAQQQLVLDLYYPVLHAPFNLGDQLDLLCHFVAPNGLYEILSPKSV